MKDGKEIAKISLEINPEQLRDIINNGRLEEFVSQATEVFKIDLKAELVKGTISSVKTSVVHYDDDDRYGTGPRPPHWWDLKKIELLEQRLSVLEQANRLAR